MTKVRLAVGEDYRDRAGDQLSELGGAKATNTRGWDDEHDEMLQSKR